MNQNQGQVTGIPIGIPLPEQGTDFPTDGARVTESGVFRATESGDPRVIE